jgi:hemolysin activation/secretion protein
MSLMKLAPETVRLRRVAKAHSMGEFSMAEYRQARREVIDNFEAYRVADDDTQPRLPANLEAGSESSRDAASAQVGKRRWPLWLGGVFLLLCLLTANRLLAAETKLEASGLTIPAVADRDPNPATSQRLPVSRVVLNSSVDVIDDVPGETLQSVIDEKLKAIRKRNAPGHHGFTSSELEEVGRFLNALGAHEADARLTARDATDLSALLEDQKARRGLSVIELEEIAAAVQTHLREAGYFLAVVYLPAQAVRDGEVAIGVLPGVLGDVQVAGARDSLGRRFNDMIGRPVTRREINTRLYALNQAQGFSARASFEPGDEVGETRLNLDVLESRALRGQIALDNYGDESTGKQRLVLDGDLINPTGRGDVLSAGLIAAIDPDNQFLGYLDYAAPVGSRRQLRARLARNDFSTGPVSDIDGDGWLLDAVLQTYLHRDQLTGLSWEVGLGRHELNWAAEGLNVDQSVNVLSTALNARRVWDESRIAADFRLYADVGSIDGDTFEGQNDVFWDLGFVLFGWHPFDLGLLPGRQKVSLELKGQLADSQLPSTRRMMLGGIGAARGFDRDAYLADQGMVLRGDLRTPLALGELSLFADVAYGKDRNEIYAGWAHLANLGLAWDVRLGQHFLSSLSWAVPITHKGSGGLDDDGAMFFWSLRYAR